MSAGAQQAELNEGVLRRWVESLNRGAPALAETFAPDAAITLVGQDDVRDPGTFLAFLGGIAAGFPGLRFTIHDLVAAGDVVAFRWEARGKHTGEALGVPASGNDVTIVGTVLDHLRDGKIVRRYELVDRLGMLQQMGALPAPAKAA